MLIFFVAHDTNGQIDTPSHGENRGSIPLGSANDFNELPTIILR
jgi:hypothetical protein